jgi:hypothetical protein
MRRALATLSAIFFGLTIRPNLQGYLVMPIWLSSQEYSKTLSRICNALRRHRGRMNIGYFGKRNSFVLEMSRRVELELSATRNWG